MIFSRPVTRNIFQFFAIFLVVFIALVHPALAAAYYTNMPASVVIGQPNFTSSSPNQGGTRTAQTLANPYQAIVIQGKLIVSDFTNERVLVYNTIPTTSGAAADVVIGQPNFTSSSPNQGGLCNANTLRSPDGLATDGTRLFISDALNHRILIYNTVPTSNNASANVVIGQTNFTSCLANRGGSRAANTLNGPRGIALSDGKFFVADGSNHRILIFNTIPATNNAAADVVVGQTDFANGAANQGGTAAANTFNVPFGISVYQNKMIVSDFSNIRVLIFNRIPTTNNAAADVVVGQPNFTSISANQGGSAGANTLSRLGHLGVFNGRLFIPEDGFPNNRVLIFNSLPTSNNASADIVLGQPNFTATAANQGGTAAANTLNRPTAIFEWENKLIVTDRINSRLLIYNEVSKNPGLTINNTPETRPNNQLRFTGTAKLDSLYTVKTVEFSVNGSSFAGVTPSDGAFDEANEDYYFEFDPKSYESKDSNGNVIDGYTIQVRATNNNNDRTDHLFYFSPFTLLAPQDSAELSEPQPVFDFSVNKRRKVLHENLSKYQVQVKKFDGNWETFIDDIPVDFASVKGSPSNIQMDTWDHVNTNNGVYETADIYATYSGESSRIQVRSKKSTLSGSYEWRVVAVDKLGHTQETGSRLLHILSDDVTFNADFPITLLNISGYGNPQLSSTYSPASRSYSVSSLSPTFFGIAFSNSAVTLTLTRQNCQTDCTKTYTTVANAESRFGINVPKGDLKLGQKYAAVLSVKLGEKYNRLPIFLLEMKNSSSTKSAVTTDTATQKRCFFFLCF